MIDRELYEQAACAPVTWSNVRGGQELIVAEIVGCLAGCSLVWLPFAYSTTLLRALRAVDIATWHEAGERPSKGELWNIRSADVPADCDAVYFGTPTIVDNKPLFPETVERPDVWTALHERRVARHIVRIAERVKMKRIVSGLGSGDIQVVDRLSDMGGGSVVCQKRFREAVGEFTDTVMVRNLK